GGGRAGEVAASEADRDPAGHEPRVRQTLPEPDDQPLLLREPEADEDDVRCGSSQCADDALEPLLVVLEAVGRAHRARDAQAWIALGELPCGGIRSARVSPQQVDRGARA